MAKTRPLNSSTTCDIRIRNQKWYSTGLLCLMTATKYLIVALNLLRLPIVSSTGTLYVHRPGAIHYAMHSDDTIHTLAWAVQLPAVYDGQQDATADDMAASFARHVGLVYRGRIGALTHHYLLVHPLYLSSDLQDSSQSFNYFQVKEEVESKLRQNSKVIWFAQEVMRPRRKRSIVTLQIEDPYFAQQWHLYNAQNVGMDLNVTGLWERNITGKGITVCVIDDGLEWTNPDLTANYSPEGSWDLNDDDSDPMPSLNGKNEHGTRCAGEIAAVRNSVCGVGVAYEARIAGLKVLDGKMTDSLEATAFNKNLKINDIYSCSWGPEDDGKTVDGPRYMSNLAIEHGINTGRGGYGTIYVVASGNGGLNGDNCNYDGYANSIYMVTIGAVDEFGKVPFYAEECACMLAVTFSSGGQGDRSIVTTDWSHTNEKGCTAGHTGTSAAAPLAAAMIALALQVRYCLSWRDFQYLIVLTAVQIDPASKDWHRNSAGLYHSHRHGFGLLTAWRLVTAAKSWLPLPWMTTYTTHLLEVDQSVPPFPQVLNVTHTVSEAVLQPYYMLILEYVKVRITVRHPCRGRLEFRLTCPSGSESVLASSREKDNSSLGLDKWTFATVRCWGEQPIGLYVLTVTDRGFDENRPLGSVVEWELIIHGTPMTPSEFQQRKRLVLESVDGRNLNAGDDESRPCPPPPVPFLGDLEFQMPDKLLKILTLTGVFLFLLAIFETFEYLLCYNEEKRIHYEELTSCNATGDHGRASSSSVERVEMVETEIESAASGNSEVNGRLVPFEVVFDRDEEEEDSDVERELLLAPT